MKSFGPLGKALALTGVLLGLSGMPALGGEAELKLLQEYIGDWRGTGQMTGARTETVVCRMNLADANGTKVNYTGRCSFAGAQMAVRGTVAYNEASNRYEAVMTANPGAYSGMAIGRRQGNGIVFDLKDRNVDQGNAYDIASSMVLKDGKIGVSFKVTFADSGESIVADIPFELKT
jgi:hypothetical protein